MVYTDTLLTNQFNEAVNIKALSIFGGVSKCQAPKTVKLFVNQNSLDFNDAESHEAAQELTLSSDNVQGNKIELRQVRFKNVRSLHILVKDNQDGEETTRIDSLDLFGTLASA